jgi:hypothetical protein
MNASEALLEARKQGATFTVNSEGQVKVSALLPLPQPLLVELRKHREKLISLLCEKPDYPATATDTCLSSNLVWSPDEVNDPGILNQLERLQRGQAWLFEEHEKWLNDTPGAASDSYFQKALDGRVAMEAQLREHHGYRGCIHGEGERCPANSVVTCDACVSHS